MRVPAAELDFDEADARLDKSPGLQARASQKAIVDTASVFLKQFRFGSGRVERAKDLAAPQPVCPLGQFGEVVGARQRRTSGEALVELVECLHPPLDSRVTSEALWQIQRSGRIV